MRVSVSLSRLLALSLSLSLSLPLYSPNMRGWGPLLRKKVGRSRSEGWAVGLDDWLPSWLPSWLHSLGGTSIV